MTLAELIAKLEKATADAPELILDATEGAALGALALVDTRITEKGLDVNGSKFDIYTPAYLRKKQGKQRPTQASIEKNRSKGIAGTAKGRYRGFVDFTLSGEMLASTTTGFENIQPTEKSITDGTAKIKLEGRDDLTKKKLEGNNNHRPGFMNPSKDEIAQVSKSANEVVEAGLNNILQ